MPANSRWDLIQRLKVKTIKNPGNGRLNNLNDPSRPQCVKCCPFQMIVHMYQTTGPHKLPSNNDTKQSTVITQLRAWYFLLSYSDLFLPTHCRCRVLLLHLITLSDTYILSRTPLDEGPDRRRDLYLPTHNTHKR